MCAFFRLFSAGQAILPSSINTNNATLTDFAMHATGIGDSRPLLILYTPHRPPMPQYEQMEGYRCGIPGETEVIIKETGNHWRKIFSIFAKITQGVLFPEEDWRAVRDRRLFTEGGATALLFQQHLLETPTDHQPPLHFIGGQQFAEGFSTLSQTPQALEEDGRILRAGNVYLTPYLDYRQFPNALIATLLADIARQGLVTTRPSPV
ncbi:conserved hypothetical protein [Hahella chejuensis KCTC 2396]|uniref:Uncharacterized protein n=1 Tax=Hahella chejuensis (strain KCTC 2396) TaxID=349521 RepID=Q2SLX8_HAHCH|nr:hypothetical protein [Hahella chejuensis]ABC28346.1 conserved hypothetical protein [Hahella chejuensis KCTC 2396]